MGTKFVTVYNRFLGKITDDMYVELTPQDTVRDLRNLILEAIPGFEFPRCNLYDYEIAQMVKNQDELEDEDFVMGILWDELDSDVLDDAPPAMVECSTFNATLTSEEVNILALLMMCAWLQRQVTSIENVRMKYSGSDFKMTSQANHLSKLLALLEECQRQSLHMQRLYKRRKLSSDGRYESNWSSLAEVSALE